MLFCRSFYVDQGAVAMILGVTPARGGSKGIPKKNIKPIAGKPLLQWTIESALQSEMIDKYIVSTDDPEIKKCALSLGVEVLDRPCRLSDDATPMLDVLMHAVKAIPCDILVVLQPTSPIRKRWRIDHCIQKFIDNKYDSLATGFMCKYIEYSKDVELSDNRKELQRQDHKGFFYDDGNVYVIKADLFSHGDRYGSSLGHVYSTKFESIDIDDEADFWMAEQVLLNGVVDED